MLIRCTEEHEKNGILAIATIDYGDGRTPNRGCYSWMANFLCVTPSVLKEWRRFNRSVIDHYLRCNGIEVKDIIRSDGEEYDPIKFDDSDDGDGV